MHRVGSNVLSTRPAESSSNFALVNVNSKCNGPAAPALMNGNEICVCVTPERSFSLFQLHLSNVEAPFYLGLNQCYFLFELSH